jgi:hypothetical protein
MTGLVLSRGTSRFRCLLPQRICSPERNLYLTVLFQSNICEAKKTSSGACHRSLRHRRREQLDRVTLGSDKTSSHPILPTQRRTTNLPKQNDDPPLSHEPFHIEKTGKQSDSAKPINQTQRKTQPEEQQLQPRKNTRCSSTHNSLYTSSSQTWSKQRQEAASQRADETTLRMKIAKVRTTVEPKKARCRATIRLKSYLC